MNRSLQEWAEDPLGGNGDWRTKIRDELLSHEETCESLEYAWLPRSGGVSCPSDMFWCEYCGTCFFNEGCYIRNLDQWLCECCSRIVEEEDEHQTQF